MIALNETVEAAAEVPFYLPTIADPLMGLTGHSFVLGEVQVHLPTDAPGVFNSATVAKIIEVGLGWYALRLTAAQTTTAGNVYVKAVVAGCQPGDGDEIIGVTGGEIAVGTDGVISFYLPQDADPIFGAPITGATFSAGQVKVRFPNGTFGNADLADVVEVGLGNYQLILEAADSDTTTRGKVFVWAIATVPALSQRFTGYVTVLGTGPAPAVVVPVVPVIPVLASLAVAVSQDHASLAIARLCEQFKDVNTPGLIGGLDVQLG